MAFVTAPDFPIKSVTWSLDTPSQSNTSAWTGTRTVVTDPWHGKWSAHVELATQQGEDEFRSYRSFLVRCQGSLGVFRLYATAGAQNENVGVTVSSSAAAAATSMLIVDYATPLLDGQFFTVNGQLCCCTADQSGGTLTFEPPLRQTAAAGTVVVTSRPYALVYLSDSKFSWQVAPWRQYGLAFDVEEAILETDGAVPESGDVAPIYPLDGAGAMPLFAYSTRKLTSTYSGYAIRVVRPSDSATLDVGFVGQELDTVALDAFLGSQLGHIDKWYDQSGHGNDATQTTDGNRPLAENGSVEGGPVLFKNKRPAIFNEKLMNIPVGASLNRNAFNIFMAAEPLFALEELGTLIQLGSSSNQLTVFQNTTDLQVNGWTSTTSLGKAIEQRPALFEAIGNGTTGTLSQDFDSTTGAISAATMAGGMIGNTDIVGGIVLSAYVSAVIGYGRVLSSPEATVIRAAMRELFNLVTVANSGRVICIGDSIVIASSGTAYAYGYMKMAQRSLPNDIAFYNLGKGGSTINDKLTTYTTDGAHVVLTEYTDNRVVFMQYGTNDLTLLGRTAAQIYADIQTYAGLVRADGGKIIVCTILPNAAWNSTQQATWNSLNGMIRSGWASFADGFCDFASNATMGPFAAASNLLLYADGLHPTRLGHTYLKPDALAALSALL